MVQERSCHFFVAFADEGALERTKTAEFFDPVTNTTYPENCTGPHMVHSHAVHLARGAPLIRCTMLAQELDVRPAAAPVQGAGLDRVREDGGRRPSDRHHLLVRRSCGRTRRKKPRRAP